MFGFHEIVPLSAAAAATERPLLFDMKDSGLFVIADSIDLLQSTTRRSRAADL
jgi:hypothetical protein